MILHVGIAFRVGSSHKVSFNYLGGTPSSSMEWIVNPNAKTTKGEGVGVRSLARIILGVKGCDGAPRWGIGKLTSKLITHTDLHKPNNKLINA
jgi:hypothetical protein